jgi:hypothetical protein
MPISQDNPSQRSRIEGYQIPNGTARSEPINVLHDTLTLDNVAFVSEDGAWTTADLAFEVSRDRKTWTILRAKDNTPVKCTAIPTGANWERPFPDMTQLSAFPWFRLLSINTGSEADVNQGATRTIYVVMRFRPS